MSLLLTGLYVLLIIASLAVVLGASLLAFVMWLIWDSERAARNATYEDSGAKEMVEDLEYWLREEVQENGGEYDW